MCHCCSLAPVAGLNFTTADPVIRKFIFQSIHLCSALEKELAILIQDGPIQARIDSHNKVLYARHTDRRSATFQEALQIGEAEPAPAGLDLGWFEDILAPSRWTVGSTGRACTP